MLAKFKHLDYSMSLTVYFPNSNIDYCPENLGVVSGKQGGRFHQNINEMERKRQGRGTSTSLQTTVPALIEVSRKLSRKLTTRGNVVERVETKLQRENCLTSVL